MWRGIDRGDRLRGRPLRSSGIDTAESDGDDVADFGTVKAGDRCSPVTYEDRAYMDDDRFLGRWSSVQVKFAGDAYIIML